MAPLWRQVGSRGRLGRRAGAGRPPRRGAPNISSLARAGRWRGSRAAEKQVGRSRLGACEGSRSRTHYLGWECRPAGEAGAQRGGAGSLADALPSPRLTARKGGGAAVGGRAGRRAGKEEAGGDRSRTQVLRSTRGPAGSRHCERRRWTARGRDSCTWPLAGTGPALRAGGPAGACTEEVGGGTARELAALLGLLAGWEPVPRRERGKGGRWSVHCLSPGNSKLAGGPLARGGSAGDGQPGATARQRLASGGRRAGGRAGADRGQGEGQGGREVSGVSADRLARG